MIQKVVAEHGLQLSALTSTLSEFMKITTTQIGNLGIRLEDLSTTMSVFMNETATQLHEVKVFANDTYNGLLEYSSKIKKIDDFLFITKREVYDIHSKLVRIHGERAWYFLGCLPAGTMIDIDPFGNSIPVEEIFKGSLVWNPGLGRLVRVKLSIAGSETGYMWKFIFSDGLTIRVTETHPMKILNSSILTHEEHWENIAARDVVTGSWTMTKNGLQKVVDVEKMPVTGIMVYNFEYDLDESALIDERAFIADGIHTFDFFCQRKHS